MSTRASRFGKASERGVPAQHRPAVPSRRVDHGVSVANRTSRVWEIRLCTGEVSSQHPDVWLHPDPFTDPASFFPTHRPHEPGGIEKCHAFRRPSRTARFVCADLEEASPSLPTGKQTDHTADTMTASRGGARHGQLVDVSKSAEGTTRMTLPLQGGWGGAHPVTGMRRELHVGGLSSGANLIAEISAAVPGLLPYVMITPENASSPENLLRMAVWMFINSRCPSPRRPPPAPASMSDQEKQQTFEEEYQSESDDPGAEPAQQQVAQATPPQGQRTMQRAPRRSAPQQQLQAPALQQQQQQPPAAPQERLTGSMGGRTGAIRESRIKDRPAPAQERDSSLKIKIELDLEVEVDLYARVKGDVTIGLM
ncbi:hypothetical protein JHW43_001280 [Diplocarpon mali]|nr:hypothetical protein JHW43_001280 [Diplocarpon mali]